MPYIHKILIALLTAVIIISAHLLIRKAVDRSDIPETDTPVEPAAIPEVTTPAPVDEPEPVAATAYAPITPDNTSGFVSSWALDSADYLLSGTIDYQSAKLSVYAGNCPSMLYRDGVPLSAGTAYTLYLNASSSIERDIQVTVTDNNTGSLIYDGTIHAAPDLTYSECSFTMNSTSTYNARIAFRLDSNLDSHDVTIQDIRLIASDAVQAVMVNQLGYQEQDQKRCTFIYNAGDLFDVVNAADDQIVYTGAIVYGRWNEDTGETDYYGDFTNVTQPGAYYIRSQNGIVSRSFTISSDPYSDVYDQLIRMLNYQKCGTALDESFGQFAHSECHTSIATIWESDIQMDVSGGWHDAGDFGRYIKTAAKASSDILLAYLNHPDESLLETVRYELEWMMKMQDKTSGGVYHSVVSRSFPSDFTSPEEDQLELSVLPVETTATADFGGTMALAYMIFKDIDYNFAYQCKTAALAAQNYLGMVEEMIEYPKPDDYQCGQYLDGTDIDGRFYTAISLYIALKDETYLKLAKQIYEADPSCANGLSYNRNGGYGRYLYLMYAENKTDAFYQSLKDSLIKEADLCMDEGNDNSYLTSISVYNWGSNYHCADNGTLLMMAYQITNDQKYRQMAIEQVNYLFGRNSLDRCFVTGFGDQSPVSVHNRLGLAKGGLITGSLVGGPDMSREDDIMEALPADTPNAKMYADDYRSYSTNEIAIYYNSSLISLLAAIR